MRRPNLTRFAVLGALSHGPASGAELLEDLRRTVAHFWNESEGQLYPVLRQLVEEGAATVEVAASRGARGRPRQVYTVTTAGLAELDRWLSEPPMPPVPPRNELLLKLFFGARTGAATTAQHVRSHRDQLSSRLTTYEVIANELDADELRHLPDLPYWRSTLHYGRAITQAAVDWCDTTLADLAAASGSDDGSAAPDGGDEGT